MKNHDQQIKEFFGEYAARFNRLIHHPSEEDFRAVADSFTPCVIAANPAGVSCRENDAKLLETIQQGFVFYRSIGTQSMNVTSLDITPLDDYHAMVKVFWNSRYLKQDNSEIQIDFDLIYLLSFTEKTPKIFAYIVGDEQQVLREHGLLP